MRCCKKFISVVFLFFLLSLCISFQAYAKDSKIIRGAVTKVSDGDTVTIRPFTGKLFKCRLYGIDAPEVSHNGKPGQPHGRAAERELGNLVLHSTVDIILTGDSSYDREICILKKNGLEINREMVKRGYAWAYLQYLKRPYASEYIEAENEARKMRRGLWQETNPTPPWEFRKRHK
ncbi:MAG: nuclease [Nitrospiraceae bacterium]|nr:MAG: nuclease [Nitrospiraceae bacterium]